MLVDIHSQLDERLSKLLHDREEKIRHDYMKQIKARDSMIKELSERNEGLSKELAKRRLKQRRLLGVGRTLTLLANLIYI